MKGVVLMQQYCLRFVIPMAVIALQICGLPPQAKAGQFGNFTYQTDGTNAVITAFVDGESVVVIPDNFDSLKVTGIGDAAFEECTSLTSITIPSGVTNIGNSAFIWCTRLTNIVIPDGVIRIGDNAFQQCTSLTNITLPGTVTSIGDKAFLICSGLTNIAVDAANPNYSSSQGVLFNKSRTRLVQCPSGKPGDYTIPDSVTSIGTNALSWCASLSTVTIPNSVTSIEDSAFLWCSSLVSVKIPDTVTNLGSSAFWGCSAMTNAVIGNGVTEIGSGLFSSCSILLSVTVPSGITAIRDSAFLECHNLTNIIIPSGVRSIGDFAFRGCSSLTHLVIPEGVTNIGNYAIFWCSSLTSIQIPESVTRIGDFTFYYCYGLTNVTIPNSVSSIGPSAFRGCSSLTNITIPASVNSIDDNAFYQCSSLQKLYFMGNAPTVGTNVIYGSNSVIVYYRNGTTGWSWSFAGRPTAQWTDPDVTNFTWKTNGAGITMTGYSGSETFVVIPDSIKGLPVTQLGSGAFANLLNANSIAIPNTVRFIDREAFSRCYHLTNVTIPDSVTDIGVEAFFYCTNLGTVRLSSSVTNIGNFAFYFCFGLTNIDVDAANEVFSSTNGVLYNKGQTTLVLCPDGKSGTFSIPNSVKSIRYDAFAGCVCLTNIIIPAGVTSIEDFAFENCPNLAGVYFEGNVPDSFGEYIFEAATSAVVYFKNGTRGWSSTLAGQPTAPWPEVKVQPHSGDYVLTWTKGILIETTNVMTGPWITNAITPSSVTVHPSDSKKFYRLKLD